MVPRRRDAYDALPMADAASRDGHRDYSGTPLTTKLGIREESRVLVLGGPEGFATMLEPLPPGVRFLRRAGRDIDVVVVFATRRAGLAERVERLAASLAPAGRIWIAYPKKASGVRTDLDFGFVQGVGLGLGLVDNKTAAIDEVFTGLQFVIRVKDRPRRGSGPQGRAAIT
jgi:hypothetical protein